MTPRPLFAVELSRAAKQIDVKRLTKQEGPAQAALAVLPGSAATSQPAAGWTRRGPGLGQGLSRTNQTASCCNPGWAPRIGLAS